MSPPSRDVLKQMLSTALQMALGLDAKAVHGSTYVAAYAYLRKESVEKEAVVAGLNLNQNGFLRADVCGEDSGTIHFETENVFVDPDAECGVLLKAVADIVTRLQKACAKLKLE